MKNTEFKVIATIHNGYSDKFGIPRQSGLVPEMVSEIIFNPEYRNDDALRGIEEYSHLWLIWLFSESERDGWRPTVRPPRLGGNKRVGVFATRSPFRPNSIGLSSVKLIGVEKTENGTVLKVSGADLMNGTPIIDIKPYIKYTDSHPDAVCSFADKFESFEVKVEFEKGICDGYSKEFISLIKSILKNDPRPSYQNDDKRIYGVLIDGHEIKFKMQNNTITVTQIKQ